MEPGARVVLATARRGRRLRAVLPLVEERTSFYGVPVIRLRAPTNQVSPDRVDLVHGAGDRTEMIAAIWRRLHEASGWGLLDLADIPEGGAMHGLVAYAEHDGHPTACRISRQSPYVPLPGPGGTLDQAIAHTGTKFRANVRRRMRNLEKLGEVKLVRHDDADPAFLERFFAMEAAGWKGERGTAIACNPSHRACYETIARVAARRGYLTLYALECDGDPVAMHFGLTIGGRYLVPKLTYDETRHEYAPGHLLVQEVLRDSRTDGVRLPRRGDTLEDGVGARRPHLPPLLRLRPRHKRPHRPRA
jgi:CelD/BcsL family acetyltransferase involved in cellulose biosynthesis